MSDSLVREVDDLVRTVSDDLCESRKPLKKQENMGSVMRSRFEDYLHERDDPPTERKMKEEIFDWNVRFLLVDNCCHSLDDLSAVLWGKFKVNSTLYQCFKNKHCVRTTISTVCWRARTFALQVRLQFFDESSG